MFAVYLEENNWVLCSLASNFCC